MNHLRVPDAVPGVRRHGGHDGRAPDLARGRAGRAGPSRPPLLPVLLLLHPDAAVAVAEPEPEVLGRERVAVVDEEAGKDKEPNQYCCQREFLVVGRPKDRVGVTIVAKKKTLEQPKFLLP